MKHPSSPLHPAFSLTELLVLLAIVTVLASLLLPAISKAREQSSTVGCLSNLRSLGAAFQAFANDHSGLLPQDEAPKPNHTDVGGWPYQVAPYLNVRYGTFASAPKEEVRASPFFCPAEKEVVSPWISYSINRELNLRLFGERSRIRQAELVSPSRYVVLADSHAYFFIPTDRRSKMADWANLTRRHGGRPNFLYGDGHAAPFTRELLGLSDEGGNAPFYRSLWQARYQP